MEASPSADFEYVWDETSGKWLSGYSAIIRWIDGGMVLLNSVSDETTRMKMQEQLQDALNSAQDANKAKSLFLANMSHEIRTPMNAVLGILDILLAEKLNNRQLQYLYDMKTSAMGLLDIINDILDVSKLHAGKLSLAPVHYDFGMFIDNVSSMASFLVLKKDIIFKLNLIEQTPIYLYGDDVRLRQVLINLLSNAIKFTEKGYVGLTVEVTDANIIFTISDTGIGIQPEDIHVLFEAFEQADSGMNRTKTGTGLGLTITKTIVEMMGGQITLESVYGQGSTFRVEIPKVSGDKSLIHNTKSKETAIDAPDAKVLVVDDNKTNLSVAYGLLWLCKIKADTTTSGLEAIEIVKHKEYDLVFMDYRMPEMNGAEITKMIRELGIKTPIIALTASAIVGAREIMLEAGMNDYLSKPIIKSELNGILEKWLPAGKLKKTLQMPPAPVETDDGKYGEFWSRIEQIAEISVHEGLDRVGGQRGVYMQALKFLIQEIIKSRKNLNTFLLNSKLNNFCTEVHGIKGSLANIGANDLSDKAFKLELASDKGDVIFCKNHLPSFLESLGSLNSRLIEAFNAINVSDETIEIPPELAPILQKLIQSVEKFDLFLVERHVEHLEKLNLSGTLKDEIEQIKDMIMIMNFDGAKEQIKKMLCAA
jgi:signal transduction histidine kinase/ActR/RegA family two-component response regulator/HPt (histidine-containing phosphotransfer) domain-containing protein